MIIAKKSLGQNFLIDKNIIKKIINYIKIKNKNIIEIGPGYGALTNEIVLLKPKKLILIEKDLSLYKKLFDIYKNKANIIINEDALKYDFNKISNYSIVSNLPYNISSKFLLKTIKLNKNINSIVCMIQSELAEKFNYRFGKMNKYKFLSQYCSEYKVLFNVSSNVFYPKPKVKSKVVKFELRKKKINIDKLELFINLFFINRRKKIRSNKNFSTIIDKKYTNQRYEDLEYKDVLKIYQRFNFFIS